MRPPYWSVKRVGRVSTLRHSRIRPELLTVQVIPQPLIRPVGVAAYLLNGLSLLSGGAAAAAAAAADKANEPDRRQCN